MDPAEESVPSGHPSIVVSRPPRPERAALKQAMRQLEALAAEGRAMDLAERMKALASPPAPAQAVLGAR